MVLALPVLALFAAPAALLLANQAESRAQSAVTRTLAVNDALQQTLGLAVDVETGARGFLVTRQEAFPPLTWRPGATFPVSSTTSTRSSAPVTSDAGSPSCAH